MKTAKTIQPRGTYEANMARDIGRSVYGRGVQQTVERVGRELQTVAREPKATEQRPTKKLVRELRANDVVDFGDGRPRVIKRVSISKKDWNHAQVYFKDGGSTKLIRGTEVTLV